VVERIGHYNPLTNPAQFDIKEDRALYWLSVGAQPSDAVRVLLQKQGTLDRLARFHAGESLDALVTEYQGIAPVSEAKAPEAKAAEPTMVERASDTVGGVAEAVAAPVAAVAEKVTDVAGAAVDEVNEAIAAIVGADEEE
jgi:small subunit ribosomal protein S16